MGFSRQESCSGLAFPSPGDLPDPGIELGSPALQVYSLPSEPLSELGKSMIREAYSMNPLWMCERDGGRELGQEPGTWVEFSSVQSLSRVWLFVTPWTTARQASLSITNSWSPSKPISIVSVMPSNHLIVFSPPLLISQHRGLFKWVRSPHEVAKALEFQLQHQYLQWMPRTDLL